MKKCFQIAVAGLLPLLLATTVSATIIGGDIIGSTSGGTFLKLSSPLPNLFGPPNSVGGDTFQSPNLFGFDEDQNILLTSPLMVNVGSNPIPIGTTVSSHFLFFDPGPTQHIFGTVDFDANVLAIITSMSYLFNSDFLANTGVNYLYQSVQGMLNPGDSVTISGPRQILVNLTDCTPGDFFRVLTASTPAPVPEPATLHLLGLGFGLVLLARLKGKFKV